jgi:hypothetical protein
MAATLSASYERLILMIVDLRTYTLKPGTLGTYLKLYGDNGWPIQNKFLPKCLGYYQVEIGVQNRVVHLWQYEDIAQRAKARAAMEADASWNGYRAASAMFMVGQENRVMKDAPFWPMKPASDAPPVGIVDKRTYFVEPGKTGTWAKLYQEEGMEVQVRHLGRCIGFYISDIGPQHQLVHLWAYKDLADRQERRARMQADPAWNAYLGKAAALFTHMENEILRPAPFWTPPA